MKILFFIFLLLISASCSSSEQHEIHVPMDQPEPLDAISLDSLWQSLVFQQGGCLTGGQHVHKGEFGSEGCVLGENGQADWRPFFTYPKEELRDFLILQLADTATTRIHTCPFMIASEGEVATYCLSKLYLVNWYDFASFSDYGNRETTSAVDCPQSWLQAILEDPEQRNTLIEEWLKL